MADSEAVQELKLLCQAIKEQHHSQYKRGILIIKGIRLQRAIYLSEMTSR